jgi:hypothetical protein
MEGYGLQVPHSGCCPLTILHFFNVHLQNSTDIGINHMSKNGVAAVGGNQPKQIWVEIRN